MLKLGSNKVDIISIPSNKIISLDGYIDGSEPSGEVILGNIAVSSYALPDRDNITSIKGGATSIGEYGFTNCSSLTSINLPEVTYIGQYSFTTCGNLLSVRLPKLTSLNQVGIFYNCPKLVSVYVPNVTAGITSYVFHSCSSLVQLSVPRLTGSLGQVFSSCGNLELLDLGSCTGLGNNAFGSCSKLSVFILRRSSICTLGSSTALNDTCFKSGGTGGTIYIPKALYDHLGDGTSSDYKAATNWATYDGYGTITWAKIEGSPYENLDWYESSL